jgi:CheY-like chemotaxis protein
MLDRRGSASAPFLAMPSPRWIVVAEDQDGVRDLWCEALTRAGHRVVGARNGFEALDLIRSVVPDLVLLDLRMPGLSGPEFLRYLGSSPALRRIPVLIVSGYLADEDGAGMGLNVVGRLPKPLPIRELQETVHLALDHPPAAGKPDA